MATADEKEAAARALRVDDALRRGDLEALRAAVDDPAVVPNGRLSDGTTCLVCAIYHSPVPFISALLDLGADPNASVDDGFPPLIAALSCSRPVPGGPARADVDEILRLLLARGADPNQRGINDWTPLHMAVAERNALAVQRLLDAGADPALRTTIDECETPQEMADAAHLPEIAAILARRGQPIGTRLRSGLTLLTDITGTGDPVHRQHTYRVQLRLWLRGGEPVRWKAPSGPVGVARLEDDGETLVTDMLVNRGRIISGLFYALDGMHVGGTRRVEIAPHLGYGDRGVPGEIPPNATLIAEIAVLAHRGAPHGR